jgi:general stress protein YciG
MKRRLTDKEVIEMRGLALTLTQKEIGEKFGIHLSHVSRIVRGKQYAHVTEGIIETRPVSEVIKNKFGSDYYVKMGQKGGVNGHTGGFYADRELARAAGAKGGRISRRRKQDGDTVQA